MQSQEEFQYTLPDIIDLTRDEVTDLTSGNNSTSMLLSISTSTTQESIEEVSPKSSLDVLKAELEKREDFLKNLSELNKTWWRIKDNSDEVRKFRQEFTECSAPIQNQMPRIRANPIIEEVKKLLKQPNSTKSGISNQFKNERDARRKDLLEIADKLIQEEKKYHGLLSKNPNLAFEFISNLPEGKNISLSSSQKSISMFCSSNEESREYRELREKTKFRSNDETPKKAPAFSSALKKNKKFPPPENNTSILNFFRPKESRSSTNQLSAPSR